MWSDKDKIILNFLHYVQTFILANSQKSVFKKNKKYPRLCGQGSEDSSGLLYTPDCSVHLTQMAPLINTLGNGTAYINWLLCTCVCVLVSICLFGSQQIQLPGLVQVVFEMAAALFTLRKTKMNPGFLHAFCLLLIIAQGVFVHRLKLR